MRPANLDHAMRCKSCGYRLDHLTDNHCPEYGREFDPNDPKTFLLRRGTKRKSWEMPIRAILYAWLAVWLWYFFRILIGPPGGQFCDVGDAIFMGFLSTIFEWHFVLITACIIYALLFLVDVMRNRY